MDQVLPDTVLKCGALQIKHPAFPPTSKVIFSTLHSPVDRQLVRTLGLKLRFISNTISLDLQRP